MADRTSAGWFSFIFKILARNPTDEHKQMAAEVFERAGQYDFSAYQMECDEALVALDLARERVDPEYPREGTRMYYGPKGNER